MKLSATSPSPSPSPTPEKERSRSCAFAICTAVQHIVYIQSPSRRAKRGIHASPATLCANEVPTSRLHIPTPTHRLPAPPYASAPSPSDALTSYPSMPLTSCLSAASNIQSVLTTLGTFPTASTILRNFAQSRCSSSFVPLIKYTTSSSPSASTLPPPIPRAFPGIAPALPRKSIHFPPLTSTSLLYVSKPP